MQVRPLELFSIVDCGLSSSQWRLGKRHPGLQALFLSNCSSTISDQDVCRSEDHLIIVRLQPRVIVLLFWFDGCIALLCLEPILLRLASSFPCLVELGIGQNTLLTDSSLSSVAR